jgi:DNA polymerase-3 subunit alpha
MVALIEERSRKGKFKDIFDFAARVDSKILNKRQLENLIKAGAFDSLNSNRHQIFESIDLISKYNSNIIKEKNSNQISLFGANKNIASHLPSLIDVSDWPSDTRLKYEGEAIGFYLSSHPLDKYKDYLQELDVKNSAFLRTELVSGFSHVKIAGVATSTKTRVSPKGRFVSVSFSDTDGSFEVSIFDDKILSNCRDLLASKFPLLINAEARKDDGGIRLTAQSVSKLDDFLASKFHQATIWIDKIDAIEAIKAICNSSSTDNAKIKIIAIEKNKQVEIALPSSYSIDTKSGLALEGVKGIVKVEMSN